MPQKKDEPQKGKSVKRVSNSCRQEMLRAYGPALFILACLRGPISQHKRP